MKQQWTCKACGKRASSRGGIEEEEGLYFVVCDQCGAKNKIVQTGGGAGSPTDFTVVGLLPFRVLYSTEAFLAKRNYEAGHIVEDSFATLEAAQKAPPPNGYTFAMIDVKGGRYIYSATFGWQFEG